MSFPYVRVSGSARERGRQYGSQASKEIQTGLANYLAAFAGRGLSREKVETIATGFAKVISTSEPELFEELSGIAEGAGIEPSLIVAMNARTEILRWQDDGCTGIACLPERTVDGHTLLCQNWDWMLECLDTTVVLHAQPDAGPEFITLAEAGLLARSGLNSAGVGVTGNYLQSDEDFGRTGLPVPLIRRKILSSSTYADALGVVLNSPRAFSSNHLIATSHGDAVDFEVSPSRAYPLFPEAGLLEHSNHFRSPTALTRLHDVGVNRLPDTLYRDRQLRKVVDESDSVDVKVLQAALKDHFGAPAAVCRHSAPRADGSISTTVASIVMDLDDGRIWIADGQPCSRDYVDYTLDSVGTR